MTLYNEMGSDENTEAHCSYQRAEMVHTDELRSRLIVELVFDSRKEQRCSLLLGVKNGYGADFS